MAERRSSEDVCVYEHTVDIRDLRDAWHDLIDRVHADGRSLYAASIDSGADDFGQFIIRGYGHR